MSVFCSRGKVFRTERRGKDGVKEEYCNFS